MDTLLLMQAWYDAHNMRERAHRITVRRYMPRSQPERDERIAPSALA